MIADSDLQDFGVHSEMMCDAFMDLYDKGKITNRYKYTDSNKIVYTFSSGRRSFTSSWTTIRPAPPTRWTTRIRRKTSPATPIRSASTTPCRWTSTGRSPRKPSARNRFPARADRAISSSAHTNPREERPSFVLRSTQVIDNERVSRIVPDV